MRLSIEDILKAEQDAVIARLSAGDPPVPADPEVMRLLAAQSKTGDDEQEIARLSEIDL